MSGLTGELYIFPLDDGRYILTIGSIQHNGSPIALNETFTIENVDNSTQSSITFTKTGDYTEPLDLSDNTNYKLKYSGSELQFSTFQTFSGSLAVSNITSRSATLSYTIDPTYSVYQSNAIEIGGATVFDSENYKLYDNSGNLVDTLPTVADFQIGLSTLTPVTDYTYTLKFVAPLVANGTTYTIVGRATLQASFSTLPDGSSNGGGGLPAPQLDTSKLIESTNLSWQKTNILESGSVFTPTNAGSYSNVGYADLGANGCLYATVSFLSTGYAYAGLSQTMTTTVPVAQFASKVDMGFKVDGQTVFAVYSGGEADALGDITQSYTVVKTSSFINYYVDGTLAVQKPVPLLNGNTYRLAVAIYDVSVNIVGGIYDAPITVSSPSVPGQPLLAYNPDDKTITVTLEPPSSDGNEQLTYKIYVQAPNETGYSVVSSDVQYPDNTFVYSLASPYVWGEYSVKVSAYNSAGESDTCTPVTIFAAPRPPAPSDITAVKSLYNAITVSWTAPTLAISGLGIGGYNIEVLLDGQPLDSITGLVSTSYVLSPCVTGVYTFNVRAFDAYRTIGVAGTTTLSFTLTDPQVDPPKNVTIERTGYNTFELNWEAPDVVEAGLHVYFINVRDSAGTYYTAPGLMGEDPTYKSYYSSTATSLTYSGVVSPVMYTIELISRDMLGNNSTTVTTSFTMQSPERPGAPTNVQMYLTPGTTDRITVTWDAPAVTVFQAPIASYSIYLQKANVSNSGLYGTSTITSYTSGPLTVGDSYNFAKVFAIDSRDVISGTMGVSAETLIDITGGGGPGGGDPNNPGNGYNNMATLELAYDGYEGTVSQTNTITVLGETRGALVADETITVNVPLAKFKKVLKYASTWDASLGADEAGEQPRPRVKFTPTDSDAALSELQAMLTGIKAKGAGSAAQRTWSDDASASHQVFGGIMLERTFTHSALDDDELPRESIRKIEEGDLTVPDIDTTVTALDSQGAGATLKGQLESLFEQAVNAGRVKTTDDADGSFKNPSFELGDSMSFLVKYNFAKKRAYVVDDQVVDSAVAGRATITVNGATIQLDGYEEDSDAYSKTYEIKLVATA